MGLQLEEISYVIDYLNILADNVIYYNEKEFWIKKNSKTKEVFKKLDKPFQSNIQEVWHQLNLEYRVKIIFNPKREKFILGGFI